MRRQPSEERDNNMPVSPALPILPKRPTLPERMPTMPPCRYDPGMYQQPGMYPPGTVFNPIGVPPGAITQPTMPRTTPTPVTSPVTSPVDAPERMPTPPGTPPVIVDTNFIQGYLRTLIGQYVRVEFILGTNMFIDREGVLMDVGVDHIVIQEPETDDLVVADLYSIKFVRVYL